MSRTALLSEKTHKKRQASSNLESNFDLCHLTHVVEFNLSVQ